jgi:hypothetical protein
MQRAHVDFAGMNSGKMQSLIDDLKTAQHTIAGFAGEFSAPLAAQGISTASVHQAAPWTADQVSSLSERLKELRDHERTTPDVPGGPTPAAPASSTPSAANPGTGGGTAPSGTTPGGNAPGGTPPADAGKPGQHGTVPARAAGTGAATAGGYPGGSGGPAGAATPPVPRPLPRRMQPRHTLPQRTPPRRTKRRRPPGTSPRPRSRGRAFPIGCGMTSSVTRRSRSSLRRSWPPPARPVSRHSSRPSPRAGRRTSRPRRRRGGR